MSMSDTWRPTTRTQSTVQAIADRAREISGADVAMLYLRRDGTDVFTIRAYSGAVAERLIRKLDFTIDQKGVGAGVARTGKPALIANYPVEYPNSPFKDQATEIGVRSIVAVPLEDRQTLIGVLYIVSVTPSRFSEEDQRLLSAQAYPAALAIENATLFDLANQRADR